MSISDVRQIEEEDASYGNHPLVTETVMRFELLSALFGIFVVIVSVLCILLYVVIQKIILSDRNLIKYSTYKIVICYGFIDIIQLCVYIYIGTFAIIGTTIDKWVEKISGFQLSFCWYNIDSLTILLAINRLTLLYFGAPAEFFFNPRMTSIILFFAIAIPSVFSLIWLTPYATYGFEVSNLMWVYYSPDFMPSYDRIITLNSSPANKFQVSSRRRDILLTLQVIINGGYTVCVSTYFMFLRPYYVPYTIIYNAIDTLLCVLWNGKSPFMHLFFNRYMREKFFEDVRNRKVSSLVLNAFLRLQHKIFSRADQAPTSSLPPNRILKGDYDCCQCGPRLK